MSRRIALWLVVAIIAASCAVVGCGGGMPMRKQAPGTEQDGAAVSQPALAAKAGDAKKADGGGGAPADPAAVNAPQTSPMIIYTATLDVIVKDLDAATPEVEKLIAGHKGFVAKSEVKGDTGSRRTATYTLRVPVAAFPALKEGLLGLGTPERNVVDTQDVTEEFVDVEARIKNLKEQEEKLNELLKEKRKEEKLEDVIKVSDRIYLVRGDIERAQGRRNYLQNRVQLSTINVTLREIKDYKPPTAPTFGSRISDTFEKSWEGLVGFGQGLVLFAVALAPWAPLWVPVVVVLAWGARRLIRVPRESAAAAQAERDRLRRPRPAEDAAEATAVEPVRPPEEPKPA
jgi:hypothetical protein